jgi:hypothetical protein
MSRIPGPEIGGPISPQTLSRQYMSVPGPTGICPLVPHPVLCCDRQVEISIIESSMAARLFPDGQSVSSGGEAGSATGESTADRSKEGLMTARSVKEAGTGLFEDVYKGIVKKIGFKGTARMAEYEGRQYIIFAGKGANALVKGNRVLAEGGKYDLKDMIVGGARLGKHVIHGTVVSVLVVGAVDVVKFGVMKCFFHDKATPADFGHELTTDMLSALASTAAGLAALGVAIVIGATIFAAAVPAAVGLTIVIVVSTAADLVISYNDRVKKFMDDAGSALDREAVRAWSASRSAAASAGDHVMAWKGQFDQWVMGWAI